MLFSGGSSHNQPRKNTMEESHDRPVQRSLLRCCRAPPEAPGAAEISLGLAGPERGAGPGLPESAFLGDRSPSGSVKFREFVTLGKDLKWYHIISINIGGERLQPKQSEVVGVQHFWVDYRLLE